MENITYEKLEIFLQKADFVFIYQENVIIHNSIIDNLVTDINSDFIDLYNEEFLAMRIWRKDINEITVDDCSELGWTIEIQLNDESVITLEWLL